MAVNNIAYYPLSPKNLQEVQRASIPADHSPKPAAASDISRGDTVYISEQSREFFKIRQLVDQLPEVRTDQVNRLAGEINQGAYQVEGTQLADAVIRKNMVDLRL
jgi:flagellar biosynthesis anti-sigma factor FlgM